jgi:hypothetical protein
MNKQLLTKIEQLKLSQINMTDNEFELRFINLLILTNYKQFKN